METVNVRGTDYVHIQTCAEAIGVCTATLQNWRKKGLIDFSYPLGRALSFVTVETAERLIQLKVTGVLGPFIRNLKV